MDDIVEILLENCTGDCVKVRSIDLVPCYICEAADEIERLREKNDWLDSHVGALVIGFRENKKEIERLREVGNKLAMHLDAFFGMLEPASNEIVEVIKQWKEASHG